MQKSWKISKSDLELQKLLSSQLNIHPLLAQILINRGIDNSEAAYIFLKGDLSHLSDPFKLPDMEKAIQRIKEAIRKKEKILIFSDYDADGITGCALLISRLKRFGLDVSHYIPNRIKEGYGLNQNIVSFVKEKDINLLITVDCGMANFEEIKFLENNSIDTIIIDHHLPKDKLPPAFAIINPKRRDSIYPYKELASCGLVFRFLQAFLKEELEEELDLVCLGTIQDMCPLNGENRILVKEGIYRLSRTQRLGVRTLIEVSGLKNRSINSYHVGFILGPRLNSAGRIDSAEKSLRLLLTDSPSEAEALAQSLNEDNLLRRKFEEEVLEEAEAEIEKQTNFKEHKIIIVAREDWHLGVLGIVANRILERFYRPAIVISLQKDSAKGSCRSIKGFHILNALNECKELLLSYGGHASACGFTMLKDNLERFKSRIYKIAYQTITPDLLLPSLEIDTELDLSLLNSDLINSIQDLEPYGLGNPKPLFCTHNLRLKTNPLILGKDTLKFYVTDGNFTYPVIGYGMVDFLGALLQASRIDLAYHLNLDIWEGEETIQLELRDIKIN